VLCQQLLQLVLVHPLQPPEEAGLPPELLRAEQKVENTRLASAPQDGQLKLSTPLRQSCSNIFRQLWHLNSYSGKTLAPFPN